MSGQVRRKASRWVRPVRRMIARFALVEEERDRTGREIKAAEDRLRHELHPVIDRLPEELRRTQQDHAALLRLLAGPADEQQAVARATGRTSARGVSVHGLFSEIERGSRAEVIEKIGKYVDCFPDVGPIADLGCGRGEFLQVVRERGLRAYGVEVDAESARACRALGLDVREQDLFEHLQGLPEATLGGVFCSQVVEHLPPDVIPTLMRHVERALVPGGMAVFETPNPATFATHVHSFWRDPTHVRPVPEPALSFAARTAGLLVEDIIYTSPVPDQDRLASVRADSRNQEIRVLAEALNAMVERLNDLLYGYQDYALVLRKTPFPGDREA